MSLARYPDALPATLSGLDHETRWGIVAALVRSQNEDLGGPGGLTFSALQDEVGVTRSSRLDYHLGKLLDWGCIQKIDGRYVVDPAVARSLVRTWGHIHQETGQQDRQQVDDTCPECAEPLYASYGVQGGQEYDLPTLRLSCASCDFRWGYYGFQIGDVSDWELPEVIAATMSEFRSRDRKLLDGFCPDCGGRGRVTVQCDGTLLTKAVPDATPPIDAGAVGDGTSTPYICFDCSRCKRNFTRSLGVAALRHPVGEAFLYDHGIEPTANPYPLRFVDEPAVIEAVDPLRIRTGLTVDDAEMTVTIDGDVQVIDASRAH